jgi:hypothetical protein
VDLPLLAVRTILCSPALFRGTYFLAVGCTAGLDFGVGEGLATAFGETAGAGFTALAVAAVGF